MDLSELKAIIRRLLSSAHCGLTKDQLCKDYQVYQSSSLLTDFKRLGFQSWEDPHFISSFQDTFTYRDSLLHGIPTERTQHIQSFVQKQNRNKRMYKK